MFRALLFGGALAWAGAAAAADQPVYAAPPAWVKPVPIPPAPARDGTVAAQLLLHDAQVSFGAQSDQFYSETAVKVLSPQALSSVGNLSFVWRPDTETLTIHKVHIIRGDQVIDVLAGGKKMTVLRRESNLELAMLDGSLTATIQPEGLQVGDVVDVAVTTERRDPVFQGRSEGLVGMAPSGVVGRVHFSALWPAAKSIRWRTTDGVSAPAVSRSSAQVELLVDQANVETPKPPNGAPARFNHLGELELSQFADWSEISSLMAPLYAKAIKLQPDSPIRAEIARIKAETADPKLRAAAALRLVQEQTRYLFLGMNFGGFIPADADVTWTRRFGDCKGKTALLLAILQGVGIDAQPVLVSTVLGDGLDERLPRLGVFDHVMVRASIGGKVYWLDGTRLGDRDIDKLPVPGFRWVLPVQPSGGRLEKIDQPPLVEPEVEVRNRLDASGGLDAPTPAHVEVIFRRDQAIGMHLQLSSLNPNDSDRAQREFWRKAYPWIDARQVAAAYDEADNVMRLSMDGLAAMDWSRYGSSRGFNITDSALGWTTSYKREPGPHQDAPFAVRHPLYSRALVTVVLPQQGAGFALEGAPDVDVRIAGVAFRRVSRIEAGVATMDASMRSLAPEFPAAEADKAAADLRELNMINVVIKATAPAIAAPAVAQFDPGHADTASEFNSRGVINMRTHDFTDALIDFTKAVELEPTNSQYLYNRGVVHFEAGHMDLALSDFNQALLLKPNDALALAARAEVRLMTGDEAQANKDFADAMRLSPGDDRIAVRRAAAYGRLARYDLAVAAYDQIIAQHPTAERAAELINRRCAVAAMWRQLPQREAVVCDEALKAKPDDSGLLQSRGFIRLRLGKLDDALADFNAALRGDPNSTAALYGKSVVEARKGLPVEAKSDLWKATGTNPKVVAQLTAAGFTP